MDYRDVEKGSSKFFGWFKKHSLSLVVFFISIYFVFSGSFKFVPNEMDWWEKICYLSSTLIFGITISSLVAETGYENAKKTDEFRDTRATAIDYCEKALPKHKEAELYVSKLIDDDIKQERLEILNKAGVWYGDIFDENDIAIKINKKNYSFKQRNAIKKARKIKKVPFTLFGFTSVKAVGRKEAPSETKRRSKGLVSDFIMRVIITMVSGSIMISFIGISISSIIYACFQLLIWFGSGFIKRIQNYNFILNDVRTYDQDRIWYLKKFLSLTEDEINNLTKEVAEHEAMKSKIKRIDYKN